MYRIEWVYPYPQNDQKGAQYRQTLEKAQKLKEQMEKMNCYTVITLHGKPV